MLFRSVTEGQLCLSTALAVNLLVLFRICAAVVLLRRVLLSRAAPFSVFSFILLRCFVPLSSLLFRSVAEEELFPYRQFPQFVILEPFFLLRGF